MTSIISILSLFLLVLVSGYFTLPLHDGQLQTSTMLSFNVDLTSERPLLPRGLFDNHHHHKNKLLHKEVQHTTDSPMELQMTTSVDNLSEGASGKSHIMKHLTTVSPLMLTTDKSKADKRGLNDLSMTTVESTTEDDNDNNNDNNNDNDAVSEDNANKENQSESKHDRREASPGLTKDTLPVASMSSAVPSELTTEKSLSAKPLKKYTGLLKDKKDGEQDVEQEKEKDDEEKKPVKPKKTLKKENEDDKVRSDDEDKEKPSKGFKKEKEDDKTQSDEDSKNAVAPTALLDSDGMKNVSNYPKEFMDLDENSTFTVTQTGLTDSTSTLKYKKGKKPLNQGEKSSTAKAEESNN